jgi:hypothetical protein
MIFNARKVASAKELQTWKITVPVSGLLRCFSWGQLSWHLRPGCSPNPPDMRLRLTVFLTVLSALGCAGSQPVHMQLPPGARIGILNVLEQQMTHVEMGSLRFDGFTKVYNVDWDIPDYINRAIENDLKARGNFTFIPVAASAPADWKQWSRMRLPFIETCAISFSGPCRALPST